MSVNDVYGGFDPIELQVGGGVSLILRQLEGRERVAIALHAETLSEQITQGLLDARSFGFELFREMPTMEEDDERSRRVTIQVTLALEYAWEGVKGVDNPEEEGWTKKRSDLARLIRFGDPQLSIPPLIFAVSGWMNGPMLEFVREGEHSGPSTAGAGAEGPSSAKAALQ